MTDDLTQADINQMARDLGEALASALVSASDRWEAEGDTEKRDLCYLYISENEARLAELGPVAPTKGYGGQQ